MRADPTKRLFWSSGGDILEPQLTEIGDQLLRTATPITLLAAETRLTGLLSDLADATERHEACRADYLTRAVRDLREAIRGARAWARCASGFRRAA